MLVYRRVNIELHLAPVPLTDRGTRGRARGVLAEEPDGEVGESGAWRLRGRSPWGYGAYLIPMGIPWGYMIINDDITYYV